MSRIQEQMVCFLAPTAFFVVATYFPGLKRRVVQLFPGATMKGLDCSTVMGGLAVFGADLAAHTSDAKWEKVCVVIGVLALNAILRPYVVKVLTGRADLNLNASFRLAIIEGLIVGGVTVFGIGKRDLTPPAPTRDRKIPKYHLGDRVISDHTISGFGTKVQGSWLLDRFKKLCQGKAFCVDTIISCSNSASVDLESLLSKNVEDIIVVLIDNGEYYSVVIYEPHECQIYHYTLASANRRSLGEEKVISTMKKLFKVTKVNPNTMCFTTETKFWRSAFYMIYFLDHFLKGSSIDNVDDEPLPRSLFDQYVQDYDSFLYKSNCSIPDDYQVFFGKELKGKSAEQLKRLMRNVCDKSWKERDDDVATFQNQIECILIKLWMMERKEPGTFSQFAQHAGTFSEPQRKFLGGALHEIRTRKKEIVDRLRKVYFDLHGELLDAGRSLDVVGGASVITSLRQISNLHGLDQGALGAWLVDQCQTLYREKPLDLKHIFIVADSYLASLDLKKPISGGIKSIALLFVLIDNGDYYSVAVYEKDKKGLYCYNAVSINRTYHERLVMINMSIFLEIDPDFLGNKKIPRRALNSADQLTQNRLKYLLSAFHLLEFVKVKIKGSSVDDVVAAPFPSALLIQYLNSYYKFLLQSRARQDD